MSVIAAAVKHMLAANMPADAIVAAVAEMEASTPKDAQAERRRARDRDRKRLRKSADSAENADTPSPKKEIPPTPPKEKTTPSHSLSVGSAREREFSDFWSIFPNRVGKRDAARAFENARTRADLETILTGVRRYAAKTDDRPWCNPATWLNQDRWDDDPGTTPAPVARAASPPNRKRNFVDVARDRFEQGNGPENLFGSGGNVELLSARRLGP